MSQIGPLQNNKVAELLQSQVAAPVRAKTIDPADRVGFSELLENRLKLSGHAQTRLQSRDIELDGAAWKRVLDGVDKAEAKGAKESLVLVDDVALVVSVKNRTVITAVDRQHLKENVFTNIDSAVVV